MNASEPNGRSEKPVKRGGWFDRLLIIGGILCIAIFLWRVIEVQIDESRVTGEVLSDLTEAECIPARSGAGSDYNVIIISMDTTRADRLGCYGNKGVKTPVLDGLARDGVLFERAYTTAPSTLPGHSTILTGLYPHHHGTRANGTFTLAPEQVSIAEIMKDAGYATAGIISAYVLDSRFGTNQGFDMFHDDLSKGVKHSAHMFRERPAEFANEVAFEWLDAHAGEKFFMWLHYFDVHAPYLPPEPFRTEYASDLYNGEIAYVDQAIGQVVDKLTELGVRDKTMIVIAGDHGESLGEHGEQTHAILIYDATIHTPLIFNAPGLIEGGKVVRTPVTNASIVPTILDLAGIASERDFDGASLIQDRTSWPQYLYGESIATLVLHGWAPLFSLRDERYKYIHAPTPELYDLQEDPQELTNLFTDPHHATQVAKLKGELDRLVGGDGFGASALAQAVQMDAETAENLQALGYVASRSTDQIDVEDAAQLDPKEMIYSWENVQEALRTESTGDTEKAVELLEACLAEAPGDVYVMRNLATSYSKLGRLADARRTLERALDREKNEPGIYLSLSSIETMEGRLDRAKEFIASALEIAPDYAQAYVALGDVAVQENDVEEAEGLYGQAIKMDPGTTGPTAYNKLGDLYTRRGEPEEARAAYEAAVKLDQLNGAARAGLGNLMVIEGKYEEAKAEFAAALKFTPNQPLVMAAYAGLFDKLGQPAVGKPWAERALEFDHRNVMALNNLALISKHLGDIDRAIELFREAIALRPDFVACRLNLAQCYYAMGEQERAVEEYQQVLKINPRTPQALANLGAYHEELGDLERAASLYRRALKSRPDYAFAHTRLGAVLLRLGKPKLGMAHLKKSLELAPDQAQREMLRTQIDELQRLLESASTSGATPDAGTNGD